MDKKLKLWINLMNFFQPYCHQLPNRSFFVKGYQMPVCARCVGVYISSILAVFLFFKKNFSTFICFFMSFIMFIDWLIQFLKIKNSTNSRRLLTGFLGGFGFTMLNLKAFKYILNKSNVN